MPFNGPRNKPFSKAAANLDPMDSEPSSLDLSATVSRTTQAACRQILAPESKGQMSRGTTDGRVDNVLGLSLFETSSPPADTISQGTEYSFMKASPSATAIAAVSPDGSSFMTCQPSTGPPNVYFRSPEQQYMQNEVMGAGTMAIHEVPYAYPVYIAGGQQSVARPSFIRSDSRAEHHSMPYMAFQPYVNAPAFQYLPSSHFTQATMMSQSSRPASASSLGSPEEALMTPLLVEDSNCDLARHYMAPVTLDSSFPTPTMTTGVPHGMDGMDGMACVPLPQPGIFAYGVQSPGLPQSVPPQTQPTAQPPSCPRRRGGDLPFSDSPLSRRGPHSRKPYDLAYHPMRQPSSYMNAQGQPTSDKVLSMDNTYMAKQRIACEGCRAKKLKCTGSRPVCYNCAKKGRTHCHYVSEIKRRGPGKKRLESEAKARAEGYFTENTSGIPAQFAFWTGQGDGQ